MKNTACLFAALAAALPAAAHAAPGLGSDVYGATVDAGEVEVEMRYDALGGGPDDGEDAMVFELGYAPSSRLRVAARMEAEKEPGDHRKVEAVGFEAIYTLGRVEGIDVAAYGEYEIVPNGPDSVETKLLLERRAGKFDGRLNLIAKKHLAQGRKVELSYAATADYAVAGDWRLGMAAFGDLGDFDDFAPRSEHFVGPVVKTEIEGLGPEIGIEAGYLFALSKARADTRGQFRFALEFEF
ncbi:MAG: hypothetical protein KGL48_05285 [Sphingomonadales bacterium]|nr:hypothetical protein [Sphingomonadales bacterium]MDE2570083.1 hypothetical protein [Sphingomonadales bacterium]